MLTRCRVQLKNYRCFSDQAPARFTLGPGFMALVGPNNSGKSTALRFFYEFRAILQLLAVRDVPARYGTQSRALWNGEPTPCPPFPPPVRDPAEIFHNQNDRPLELEIALLDPAEGEVESVTVTIQRPGTANPLTMKMVAKARQDGRAEEYVRQPNSIADAMEGGKWLATDAATVMADADRMTSLASELARAIYIGPFRNAIHTGTSASYFDLQIGQAFVEAWRQFKTGSNVANNLAAIRVTDEIKRTFGFTSLEINVSAQGDTLQLFVDGQSYLLAELGAGLSQFVVLLAFVATRHPSVILIDEPELNLHPLLQTDLLLRLGSYAEGTVFFGTHSLGLARSVAHDIYVCRRDGRATILASLTGYPRLAELLGELSFGGYAELGFSKLLLVEGPHDLTAIRELLRLYQKDHEVVLMPLGGASLINRGAEEQLQEIKRVTSDITALVDSERTSEASEPAENVRGFLQACEASGVACHVLKRRALEHYLPERAIRQVKGASYRGLLPYEEFAALEPRWGKAENAAIAREMTVGELAGTDLGAFLEKL